MIFNFSSVSETLLIPLYCRAMETESREPVIKDAKAVAIMRRLDQELATSDRKLAQALVRRRLPKKLVVTMSLRTRRFDEYVRSFVGTHEHPVVVTMGCGLDTRASRIDDERIDWYDLDLPEVIAVRQKFFADDDRHHSIGCSVLDFRWMEQLPKAQAEFLFVAEGLFMYLPESEVQKLLLQLQARFPGSELACEVSNRYWVQKMQSGHYRRKFQKQLYLDEGAVFRFGISNGKELETWNEGIDLLDEWTYFDEHEKKLGWYNWFGQIELLRKVQWIAHYKLG
ncbi:MAG TPA: class I SAM-dependent methyltransferase [Bacillota bacterium]